MYHVALSQYIPLQQYSFFFLSAFNIKWHERIPDNLIKKFSLSEKFDKYLT